MIAQVVASGLCFRTVEAELHRVAALSAEFIRKTADEIPVLQKECAGSSQALPPVVFCGKRE